MKLYSYWRSSSAWRVRLALQIKGMSYEYEAVNLSPEVRAQTASDYVLVNPLQQVPTLEWEEKGATLRLTQSVAIVEYLEELQPQAALLPRAPLLRARVREAVEIVNSGIQPLQNTWTIGEVRQLAGEAAVVPWMTKAMLRGLRALEVHAEKYAGRCLIEDEVTLADVYLVPQLYNARRFGIDVAQFPRLAAVELHVSKLAAFAKARPEVQPDATPS
jgi:maleylpyruvate isomerase